jgi:fumarylacetoacetase
VTAASADLPAGAAGADLSAAELAHLPYGSRRDAHGRRFVAVRVGEHALDLTRLTDGHPFGRVFADGSLNPLLGTDHTVWADVRAYVTDRLRAPDQVVTDCLAPLHTTIPVLPIEVADYVDFYASENHANNVGRIFRPDGEPLTPNWKHLPIGYHGRAGTVVVSGTSIRRPSGQARDRGAPIRFGPSQRLDIEAEVGFVVGGPTALGEPVDLAAAREHLFGVCLLNDWSARDIQAWEYVPLGPFLGKSFATSVSEWITPLAALGDAWIAPPPRDPSPQPYLDDSGSPAALDLTLEIAINGSVVSRPPFATMYWTADQMLAHLTVNGASLRAGDLFASGTVSGPEPDQRGSLLELSWNGATPIRLADGTERCFLNDGDEVVITASAPTSAEATGGRIHLGEVRGRIEPAR